MWEHFINDRKEKKVVRFKVTDYEHKYSQYADIFYNHMIEDPETKEYHRLLESILF